MSQLVAILGWGILVAPPLIILGLVLRLQNTSTIIIFILTMSIIPFALVAGRKYFAMRRNLTKLNRFNIVGINDVIINPDTEKYRRFLLAATSSFAFQGVGAEKLTRDFDIFQSMVSRCGTPANPVRLLLISPDVNWLKDGAARRGLGRSSFSDKQIQSLQRIARIKAEYSGHITVRFYSSRPVFRMMFANSEICWLGHYTESAALPGENEYAEQSNSSVVLRKPEGKAPDQQLYGALEMFFEEQWETSKESEWDFRTYLP